MRHDHDHPAFGVRDTQNTERHLRLVDPPTTDPCGNAIAGAFVAVMFTLAVAGLVALAVWA